MTTTTDWTPVTNMTQFKRTLELLAFACEEGIDLPMPPADIIDVENCGGTVDLITGEITSNGADLYAQPQFIHSEARS